MPDTITLNATISISSIWENKQAQTGTPFWKFVTPERVHYTAFDPAIVKKFIEGQTAKSVNNALVYNFNPPISSLVYFQVRTRKNKTTGADEESFVLVPTPEGTPEPAVTKPPQTGGGGRPWGGGGKGKEWKPKDERPSLVTMTESFAKDLVMAVINNSADLKLLDYDNVLDWADKATKKLSRSFLSYTLDELKTLGFDPKEAAK